MLCESSEPLASRHDLVMLDLDGVVYIGNDPVPGVPGHLQRLRGLEVSVGFVTNNASRPPGAVADRLEGMGIRADGADVVTSAQAAATLLRQRFGAGARVLVLGGQGLREAVTEAGLEPTTTFDDSAAALATGYGPDVLWRDVMRAAVAVRDGLPWVASNTDMSIPTPYGQAPGHGVLVRTLADFAGVEPEVAGKPAAPLLEETVRRLGGTDPLMVGDRLDTDILGASGLQMASLLVLTGVSGLAEVVSAPADQRPSYLSPTLAGLFEAHPVPRRGDDGTHVCGGWSGLVDDGRVRITGAGGAGDWWRVVATAAWTHLDETGRPVDTAELQPPSS